jgi:hypothetical protein
MLHTGDAPSCVITAAVKVEKARMKTGPSCLLTYQGTGVSHDALRHGYPEHVHKQVPRVIRSQTQTHRSMVSDQKSLQNKNHSSGRKKTCISGTHSRKELCSVEAEQHDHQRHARGAHVAHRFKLVPAYVAKCTCVCITNLSLFASILLIM